MGRSAFKQVMEQRLRDLGVQMASVGARLADSPEQTVREEVAARLDVLEGRRAAIGEDLAALEGEREGGCEDLRLQLEHDWDTLVQDFEEHLASLA